MSESNPPNFDARLMLSAVIWSTELFHPEEKRVIDARFAYELLPGSWRALLFPGIRHAVFGLLNGVMPGALGMFICRVRFTDEALAAALEKGVEQVVCLGAGFDDRAYRIPGIEKTRFFELDLPEPQIGKRARLKQVLGELPEHVTFVPIDFDRQNIEDEMLAAGFKTGLRTFFIWESVTQYITAEAVDATLRFVTRSAPGSLISFTYVKRGFIDGTARSEHDEKIFAIMQRRGIPFIFGIDPAEIEEWLAERGFRIIDHADALDYRTRYLVPVGREMELYGLEQSVLAEVADA